MTNQAVVGLIILVVLVVLWKRLPVLVRGLVGFLVPLAMLVGGILVSTEYFPGQTMKILDGVVVVLVVGMVMAGRFLARGMREQVKASEEKLPYRATLDAGSGEAMFRFSAQDVAWWMTIFVEMLVVLGGPFIFAGVMVGYSALMSGYVFGEVVFLVSVLVPLLAVLGLTQVLYRRNVNYRRGFAVGLSESELGFYKTLTGKKVEGGWVQYAKVDLKKTKSVVFYDYYQTLVVDGDEKTPVEIRKWSVNRIGLWWNSERETNKIICQVLELVRKAHPDIQVKVVGC